MNGIAALFKPLLDWAYRRPQLFPRAIDVVVWPIALVVGAILKLVFSVGSTGSELIVLCIAAVALHMGLGWAVGLYRHRWRVSSFDEVMALSGVWAIVAIILILGNYAARQTGTTELPTTAVSIGTILSLIHI